MSVRVVLMMAVALIALEAVLEEREPVGQLTAKAARRGDFKSLREKASYAIGVTMASSVKKQGVDIDVYLLIQGIRDASAGNKLLLTDEQAAEAIAAFEKDLPPSRCKAPRTSSRATRSGPASRPPKADCSTRLSRPARDRGRRRPTRFRSSIVARS